MNIFFKNTKVYKLHESIRRATNPFIAEFRRICIVNGSCSLLLSCPSVLHTDMFVSNNFRVTKNVLKEHK